MKEPKVTATREEKERNNNAVFMERGPGLDYRYQTWVIARDRKNKRMLLGGLGCMGLGTMWFDDDGSHSKDPEYANVPDQDSLEQK